MNEATKQQIFEPFFTTKGIGEGTGLGLSMVQGIVAQSGGYIDVYSEPGHGTTFKIHLPALAGEAADLAKPATVSAQRGNETILVVEDQTEVREYAVAALKTYGYRVIPAADAGEALMISERESSPIHLVLTDVVMPNTSGRELVARLTKGRPGLKVLFMSGYTDDVLGRHGVLETGIDLIEKPFSPEDLAGKVRELLGPPAVAARVLVVDDDAGVRSFLRAALKPGGYEVTEASDGKQALRRALTGDLDLVITDSYLKMPEQDGIEIIRELRRQLPGIGIIAISGAFAGDLLEMGQAPGADAVLDKPVDPGQLLKKAAEVLELRR
jgi:CheY-like chemotaxis protein